MRFLIWAYKLLDARFVFEVYGIVTLRLLPVLKAHVGMIEILQSKEVYVIQQIAVALHVHGPDLRDVNRIFVGQGAFSQANARGSRDWGSVLV